MQSKELYFIALLPPSELAQKIHTIKEEIAKKYKSYHSLKVPEHITVIPPFRCDEDELNKMHKSVQNVSSTINPFEVQLKNFGHFGYKVMFIMANSHPQNALPDLFQALKKVFISELSFINITLNDGYTSHLTIANRDLNQSAFRKAWGEFKEREFEETFSVSSLFILNHPNNIWTPFKEFKMKG